MHGVAWVLYRTYEVGLWPMGTLLSGLEGIGLLWPTIAAVPILAIAYASDRRVQADKEKPATKKNSAILSSVVIIVAMLAIYYIGFAIDHLWN